MGKRKASRWFKVVSVFLAFVLLFLAFRGVQWDQLFATWAGARLPYVILCCLIVCMATFLRGLRWWVLMHAGASLPARAVVWASIVGQVTNSFIPARGGDVYRVVYLARHADVSKSFALATTLTERVMDVACITIFGVLAMFWLEKVPEWMAAGTRILAICAAAGVAFLFAIPALENPLQRLVPRLPLPQAIQHRVGEIVPRFIKGLRTLYRPVTASAFFTLTVLIWLSDALSAFFWAIALHLTLPFEQAVIVNAVLALSQIVPTTPGGIGVYQFLAVTVLVPFGFTSSQAMAYILSAQMQFYLVMAALGFIALLRPEKGVGLDKPLCTTENPPHS